MATKFCRWGLASLLLLGGCATATDTDPQHATLDKNTIVRLADKMRAQGDMAMAADFYQRAITEDPKNSPAYYGLATLLAEQGDLVGAERAYREALRYDEHNATLRRDYAKLLLAQARYGAAATQYRAALDEESGDSKALNGLGVALDQLGDHSGAQAQYRLALEHNAEDMTALNNLGMSLIMVGDYAGAVQQLTPAANSFKAPESLRQNLLLAQNKLGAVQLPVPEQAAPLAPPKKQPPRGKPHSENLADPLDPAGIQIAMQDEAAVAEDVLPPVVAVPQPTVTQVVLAECPLPIVPVMNDRPMPSVSLARVEPLEAPPVAAQRVTTRQWHPLAPLVLARVVAPTVTPGRVVMPQRLAAHHAPVPQATAPTNSRELRAVLGPYATGAMAEARQNWVRVRLGDELPEKTVINVVTRLTTNNTPQFMVYLYGFADQDEVSDFCAEANHAAFTCRAG